MRRRLRIHLRHNASCADHTRCFTRPNGADISDASDTGIVEWNTARAWVKVVKPH